MEDGESGNEISWLAKFPRLTADQGIEATFPGRGRVETIPQTLKRKLHPDPSDGTAGVLSRKARHLRQAAISYQHSELPKR